MFDHINTHYGVNACIGRRVIAYGKPGTIVKDFGHYIGIVSLGRIAAFTGTGDTE
ncbi:hypothetical protein [Serratia symbiotica]|uniref:hypothetical protein n=1 Tax=Serratia symbiotica TaxID=138074 RepID=UPI001325245B|nr:hypothetical protein [Serratia symbiotica]QTP13418.1 hypothetical protein GPZ83_0000140 [Serratia symbiotica]